MTGRIENLPIDTRLLSDAIIELNISRHNVAIYPQHHPVVEKSLSLVFEHLKKLFELRREITLAIAKDTLIIDDFSLDKKNPVYREFALCLYRMNIASLTFMSGVTQDEIYAFHSFLLENTENCSPEDVQKSFDGYNIRHITAAFIDYSAFNMVEGKSGQKGGDVPLWEKYIFGLLEGSLQTGETSDVLQGIPPEKLALLLNRANMENLKEDSYDRVITSYVRSSSERAFSEKELKKLLDFINELRPELKRQFLSSSVNVISKDIASVKKSLGDMSVDNVIDLLSIINEQTVAIPEALKNVLDKFSRLHEDSFMPPRYGGGLIEHDILLSPEITGLLEDANFKAFVTDAYQQEIQRLLKFDTKTIQNARVKEFEKEWTVEHIETVFHEIILAILSSDDSEINSPEDYEYFIDILKYHVEQMIDTGQYHIVLKTFLALESNVEGNRFPDIASSTLQYYHSQQFVLRFVNSLRIMGREMREDALQLCKYYGEHIVPSLIDALIEEESQSIRRFMISLISNFRDKAIPEALKRIDDDRWFVKRNMLFILNECGSIKDLQKVRQHCDHENPKVCFEAIKCLLKNNDGYGVASLKKYLTSTTMDSFKKAVSISGAFKVRDIVPDLIQLLEKKTITGKDFEDRIPVVQALGQIADPRALGALRKILSAKTFLFKGSLEKLKTETYGTLEKYPYAAVKDLIKRHKTEEHNEGQDNQEHRKQG